MSSSDWTTIIVGVIGIIFGFLAAWLFRDNRTTALGWYLKSSTSLTQPFANVQGGKLEVRLDDVEVRDVHLVVLGVQNVGDYPVTQYRQPVTITLKDDLDRPATLLKAVVTDMSAPGVCARIKEFDEHRAIAEDAVLKEWESYEVQLLISRNVERVIADDILITADYIGTRSINMHRYHGPKEVEPLGPALILPGLALVGAATSGLVSTAFLFVPQYAGPVTIIVLLPVFICLFFSAWFLFSSRAMQSRVRRLRARTRRS